MKSFGCQWQVSQGQHVPTCSTAGQVGQVGKTVTDRLLVSYLEEKLAFAWSEHQITLAGAFGAQ